MKADFSGLNNLVPYTHPSAAWSDRHSNIALSWGNPEEGGLQMLQVLIGWAGCRLTQNFLNWRICEGGNDLPLNFQYRNFRPDKIIEVDSTTDFELTVIVAYPERNALAIEIFLKNLSNKKRDLELSFNYPGKDVPPDWEGTFPAGLFVSLENEPDGSWSTLFSHKEHGRNVTWVQNFVAGMKDGTTIEMVCLSDLSKRKITLMPNGNYNLTIPMAFGTNRGIAREVYNKCKNIIDKGWSSEEETKRWAEIFKRAPSLPEKYRGRQKYERLYMRAIAGLESLFIQGDGGYTGFKRIPWTTKDFLAIAFFWDTAWSCVGAREFNPGECQEAVQCFVDNVTPRGSLPGTLCDHHRAGEGQSPIMSWATWNIYQRCKDKEWLSRMYAGLAGNTKFWLKYHSSKRGLCQFFNAGQVADDDARFDPVQKGQGNQPLSGFESPDLNAFLVMDMKSLSLMANELGLNAEAEEWEEKSGKLAKLIVDMMYFPEDSMFYDVKTGTHEKFTGVKSPNMFLPLWAGIPLPEKEIKNIIEKHMLNPDEFFRELPFPSLSYDNPEHNPYGYWRGSIWPHIVYWMIQILWKYGYKKEAELTAGRVLEMILSSEWIYEHYESGAGKGIGVPEYNWTQAATIELLLERYKNPLP